MSEPYEHTDHLDPEVCPRCGGERTDAFRTDQPMDEDLLGDKIRQCEDCVEKDAEHDGEYRVCYGKTLQCVSWEDDDGVTHELYDADFLVQAAAHDLLKACEDLLEQVTGPAMVYGDGRGNDGTKTGLSHQEFNALLKNRIAAARTAIAKAKGECHE